LTDPLTEAFDLFDQCVKPSPTQKYAAVSRGQRVSQLLSQNKRIVECRIVGSLIRSTAIRHFSDIDILAVFDSRGDSQDSPQELLDLTSRVADSFGVVVSSNPTTVSLQYSDWPNVDILPARVATTDVRHRTFRIPAGSGQTWQLYLPDRHDRMVRDGSARLGPRFKTIVRIVKWWNRLNNEIVRSYEIEELVNDLFKTEIPVYSEAIYRTFNAMLLKLASAGVPDSVMTAWLLSREARDLATAKASKQDLKVPFRRLFGEQFPLVCS
jgi:predicted nucleotidyltransferase